MPGTSTEQVVDKGIRQKSTKEWTHSLTAVPFVRGTEACSLGLRETPACIHVIQRLSQPRVACWHGFRQNSQKNGMRVYTLSDRRSKNKIACLNGLRSEGVKEFNFYYFAKSCRSAPICKFDKTIAVFSKMKALETKSFLTMIVYWLHNRYVFLICQYDKLVITNVVPFHWNPRHTIGILKKPKRSQILHETF